MFLFILKFYCLKTKKHVKKYYLLLLNFVLWLCIYSCAFPFYFRKNAGVSKKNLKFKFREFFFFDFKLSPLNDFLIRFSFSYILLYKKNTTFYHRAVYFSIFQLYKFQTFDNSLAKYEANLISEISSFEELKL